MVYEYECSFCKHRFDVVKRVAEMDKREICGECGNESIRQFVPQKLHLVGTKVEEAEYNPGLGCVVRGKKQRDAIAKQKGLIEVGTTPPDMLHKMYDQERRDRHEKAWAAADKGWVGAE